LLLSLFLYTFAGKFPSGLDSEILSYSGLNIIACSPVLRQFSVLPAVSSLERLGIVLACTTHCLTLVTMSGPAERESRAKHTIQEIVRKHGFVKESTLQAINALVSQNARREVEEALLAKDIQIGSSVLT